MIDLLPAVFFQILGATSAFMMDEKNLERFFFKKVLKQDRKDFLSRDDTFKNYHFQLSTQAELANMQNR